MRLVSSLRRRLSLLVAFTVTEWRADMAYTGNRIAGVLTPLVYVASFLVFIDVLYGNISSLAGYTHNQMLFLILVGQLAFYLVSFWGVTANENLNKMINTGNLDFVLLRPVNTLYLITISKIKLFGLLTNMIGPLVPVVVLVNWSALHLEPHRVLLAIPILLLGVLLNQSLQFILTLPAFWTGRAYESHLLLYAGTSQTVPLEGLPTWSRFIFTGAFPTLLVTSVTASVMLGKSDPAFWLPVTIGITVVMITIKRLIWRKALRQYASASS